MTKYKRSIEKVTQLLEEILVVHEVSLDSKVILIVLAVVMPPMRFNRLVDNIEGIGTIRGRLQQINILRHQFGKEYRDYTILYVLKHVNRDLECIELLQLIS